MDGDEPPVSDALRQRLGAIDSLSRWERAELGRALRRAGLSYGEIARRVPAAKATIAGWCKGIKLSEAQRAAIRSRTGGRQGVPVDTQWRRHAEVAQIRARASETARALLIDPAWTAGVALYWAEGFKTENLLGMANSDEVLLRYFIAWTRRYVDTSATFRAKLNLHEDNDEMAARLHWKEALQLSMPDFSKTFIKPAGTGHRKNHLPHGVCQVRMRSSTNAFHCTMAWIEFVRESPDLGALLSCSTGR